MIKMKKSKEFSEVEKEVLQLEKQLNEIKKRKLELAEKFLYEKYKLSYGNIVQMKKSYENYKKPFILHSAEAECWFSNKVYIKLKVQYLNKDNTPSKQGVMNLPYYEETDKLVLVAKDLESIK